MSDSLTQNDINYMEAKSIFVQLLRSIPSISDRRPIDLPALAERAATSKDPVLVRRGIKVQSLLSELDSAGVVDKMDDYRIMQDEVAAEMVHLGNAKEKVVLETRSLEAVYKTICDHNNYLRSQLESYKAYLQNVRSTSGKDKGGGGVGVVTVNGKEKKATKNQVLGPYRYTHAQFEKEGIIVESNVPDNRYVSSFPLLLFSFTLLARLERGGLMIDEQISTLISYHLHLGHSLLHCISREGINPFWKWI